MWSRCKQISSKLCCIESRMFVGCGALWAISLHKAYCSFVYRSVKHDDLALGGRQHLKHTHDNLVNFVNTCFSFTPFVFSLIKNLQTKTNLFNYISQSICDRMPPQSLRLCREQNDFTKQENLPTGIRSSVAEHTRLLIVSKMFCVAFVGRPATLWLTHNLPDVCSDDFCKDKDQEL